MHNISGIYSSNFYTLECYEPKKIEENGIELLKSRLSNKEAILNQLERMELSEVWDQFLKNQVDLYFEQEIQLFSQETWWHKAETVLDIGSGNGEYLLKLARAFENKKYLGIEKNPEFVEKANFRAQNTFVAFILDNIEKFNESLIGKYDIAILRLTLQHLQQPMLALEHVSRYLKPEGHLLIIDACDSFRKASHYSIHYDEAIRNLNEKNQQQLTGNRLITLQLLKEIKAKENFLSSSFDITFTNLNENAQPNPESKQMLWQSERERILYFNHALHFLEILKKGTWKILANSALAYDELRVFMDDEHAWIRPGQHVMILEKKAVD